LNVAGVPDALLATAFCPGFAIGFDAGIVELAVFDGGNEGNAVGVGFVAGVTGGLTVVAGIAVGITGAGSVTLAGVVALAAGGAEVIAIVGVCAPVDNIKAALEKTSAALRLNRNIKEPVTLLPAIGEVCIESII